MDLWIEGMLSLLRGIFTIILMIALIVIPGYLVDGDFLFGADVPAPSDFEIPLLKNTQYGLWVLDENGPEEIDISFDKGSYHAFRDTFLLMHPEGDYLPYHPVFSVREDGMYSMHIEPRGNGMVRIGIRKDTGINPRRYFRDFSMILQNLQSRLFPPIQ
jgi:hypothetical protein